tara:strand:- start:1035 stop:1925 length:891 start_codon:yes stop_codon:yes gene_type:complete
MTIAVVFLLRANKDNKSEYIFQYNRFIDSLKANYVKEIENKFYIILKGDSKEYIKKKINKEKFLKINIFECEDKTFDVGAYFNFHNNFKNQFTGYIFFNSHSEINGKDWYGLLSKKIVSKEYDLVGASASYSSLKGPKNIKLEFYYLLWFLYLRLKGLRYYSFLQPFFFDKGNFKKIIVKEYPSPHIRTNAFCISSEMYESFFNSVHYPINKFHIHILENSSVGLTSFVKSSGGQYAIVTNNGNYLNEEEWGINPSFNTFSDAQPFIIDNQIRNFYIKTKKKREYISFSIWGSLLK